MKKTIAILIASAVIVGTAYYWWILVIAFIGLIGWSMFRVSGRKEKKRETPVFPIEDYLD